MKGTDENRVGIGGDYAIWAGAQHSAGAPFRVGYDGSVYATIGNIGKFTIESGNLIAEDDDGTFPSLQLGTNLMLHNGFRCDYLNSMYEVRTDSIVEIARYSTSTASSSLSGLNFIHGTDWVSITSFGGTGTTSLGTDGNRFKNLYITGNVNQTSDENEKDIISGITSPYEEMFMKLQPILYRFKNWGTEDKPHDRIHCGLGAQSFNKVAIECGLDTMSVAAICRSDLDTPTIDGRTEAWGIAYSELHGLEIHMIQKNTISLEEHEKQIQELKELFTSKIEALENKINKLEASA